MPYATPTLRMTKRAREAVQVRLLDDLDTAIESSRSRCDRMFDYDRQLRNDPFWAGLRPRWRGASDVVDTLTSEHHFEQVARIVSVMRQEQWWVVNATRPQDMSVSGQFEGWLNDKVAQYDLATVHLYDLAYNAGRHSYAWLYCGWKQTYETVWETLYRDKRTNQVVTEKYLDPTASYEVIERAYETVKEEGLDLRVPHATDVVMWPPTCQNPAKAQWIAERCEYTASQLVDMIDDIGLDEEVVYDVIGSGTRTGRRDTASYQAQRDRDEELYDPGEVFTCWVVIGRPPLVMGDDRRPLLENRDRRRDYCWIACPDRNAVMKFSPSIYRARPWVLFQFLPEPGRLEGDSVCSLTMGLQREATIAMRTRGDLRDLVMSPTLLVPDDEYDELTRFSVFAGAMIPYKKTTGPQGIVPLQQDKSGFEAAMLDGKDFRERAGALFSAQARETLPQGQRATATEIELAAGGADDKFDLILSCMHRGMTDLAKVIISHYGQFLPPEGEQVVSAGKVLDMTPEVLEKRFRIAANGSSESADTQLQAQRTKILYDTLIANPIVMQKAQMGDFSLLWAITARFVQRFGERDPQSLIGQEPTPPPNSDMIVQMMGQALMQFAQAGDPNATQLLMMLNQWLASQQAPQQPAMGAPPGQVPMGPGGVPAFGAPDFLSQLGPMDVAGALMGGQAGGGAMLDAGQMGMAGMGQMAGVGSGY